MVSAIRLWDESHQAAEQAWQNHHERVEEAARAIAQDAAPPDSWLSISTFCDTDDTSYDTTGYNKKCQANIWLTLWCIAILGLLAGEVQYRERARKHVSDQAVADELLEASGQQLAALEAERVQYWSSFAQSYRGCCSQQGVVQDEAAVLW